MTPRSTALATATLASALVAGLLGGCTVGPRFTPPTAAPRAAFWPRPAVATPAQVATSHAVPDPIDPDWWTSFHDPVLTGLEQRLAGTNLDLQDYAERLQQSRAQLGVARADALPNLGGNASYTRERPSSKGVLSLFSGGGGSAAGGGSSFASQGNLASGAEGTQGGIPSQIPLGPFNLFQYGFDASWEIDLFGHARREVEAARANVAAATDAARDALVSTEAELARDYLTLRGTQQRIAITQNDLASFDATLHLTRERARAGLTTSLDVSNSQSQLSAANAQLAPLLTQQAELLNAISLLLGAEPGTVDAELTPAQPVPPVPATVPVGLPSELARRRPDIRAAEAQLHAATAQVGVAVADFYPKITLSGSIGLQALQMKDLGNWASRQYGFGPTIQIPIFEGGRLRATLELRKSEQRAAAINYRRVVLGALRDISNALAAYEQEQQRHVQLGAAVDAARQAVVLSRQRYRQGIASFIEVLDAQRSQFSTENDLADSTANVATDLVALYKALGGGWQDRMPG